jgi:phage gp45-like
MHRQTPLTQGFTGYTSGGARALIDTIDDGKMMQQMKGSMMGEGRESVECPQNYGFSSVVKPATKGKDGKIEDCAEGFMSYFGGNRTSNFCGVMDDRRYRPMGMKPGENSQYDDLGQMTLLRRTGVYILSLDNPDDSQQQGGGGSAPGSRDGSSGSGSSGQTTERFVSVRHVEKKKQDRPKRGGAQGQGGSSGGGSASPSVRDSSGSGTSGQSGSQQDYKHEGESVNNEMRVSKKRIEFRDGDDSVVGYYDKQSKKWCFIGEIHLGTEDSSHPVYGVNGGVGMTTETSGAGAVLVNAPKPGPPTSQDGQPLEDPLARIAALERRVAELEGRRA